MADIVIEAAEVALGLLSFTILIAWWEWRNATKRLKKEVTSYIKSVEFEWQNQTEEFALMHRVRAFEILLRNVQAQQPRTPGAHKRVEQVRDVLESFHRRFIPIFRGEHLPLPKFGEFPALPDVTIEAEVRKHVLEGLRAIKWLRLKEPAEQ